MTRVFLSGDSAGGNIAHHVALKVIQEHACEHARDNNNGLRIKGVIPIHPYFGSEERTEKEKAEEGGEEVRSNDMFWRLSIPEGLNRDYYGCNVEKMEVCESVWGEFPAIQVHVAGRDFLKERGEMYVEFVKKRGVKVVEIVEAEEERHIFHVLFPQSDATRLLQANMIHFINTH